MTDARSNTEVAEMPDSMESTLQKMKLIGGDYADMATQAEWLWRNPVAYAEGEGSDYENPPFDEDMYHAFMLGVNFGVTFELAYPSGRRDEWPVAPEERDHNA